MRSVLDIINDVIEIERDAIAQLSAQQHCDFEKLIDLLIRLKGRVVIAGIGKSGIIGRKIATTLASTGTPSLFLHPVEALHGDLGMLTADDAILLISYSGETEEILRLVPFLKQNGSPIISMTGYPTSKLAQHSDFHINIHVEKEACPLRLAPTSSTTAALVMGDALSAALIYRRGFKEENFARFHPGGRLGKMLLTTVKDVMQTAPLPLVSLDTPFSSVVSIISKGGLGTALVLSEEGRLEGIITDGDVRRALERHSNTFSLVASAFMNKNPKTLSPNETLFEAQAQFSALKITVLVVAEEGKKPIGLLHIHSLNNV